MRFEAVIFDLDGTLIETERLVIAASMAVTRRMGLPDRPDVFDALIGTVGDEAAAMRAAFGAGFDPVLFELNWREEFVLQTAKGIPLRPGVAVLLAHLDAIAMPRAIATNSRTEGAMESLAIAGILGHFDPVHIHGRDRVSRPKPAPDLYLHAALGLGVDPARCLAFEDSTPGAEAALAAGMTVIHVPDQQRLTGNLAVHVRAADVLAGALAVGLM